MKDSLVCLDSNILAYAMCEQPDMLDYIYL